MINIDLEKKYVCDSIKYISEKIAGRTGGGDIKHYVLSILFFKFLSEQNKEVEDGFLKGSTFSEVLHYGKRQLQTLNHQISEAFSRIEKHYGISFFYGIDLTSPKLGETEIEKNYKLLLIMEDIDSVKINLDSERDIFGDAYEYLIDVYSSSPHRIGGEYYTPAEISTLLSEIVTYDKDLTKINSIYDPTCGSGSLLLKCRKKLPKDNQEIKVSFQEINRLTYHLCMMNMVLRGVNVSDLDGACDDTLINPQHLDKRFDIIVANPPFSLRGRQKETREDKLRLLEDPRYRPAGVLAPSRRADFAFVLHCIYHLNPGGTAAILLFPGALYRKGAEENIRKYLIDNELVETVIQLPPHLFSGTTTDVCIVVIKKQPNKEVYFIDASREYEVLKTRNRLQPHTVEKILELYKDRKDRENCCKTVTIEEIAKNNYILSVNRYVDKYLPVETSDPMNLEEGIEEKLIKLEELKNIIRTKLNDYSGKT